MINFKAVGNRIKKIRKEQSYTQEALAEILDISVEHLSRIETGSYRPSLGLIENMCGVFDTDEAELLFGIESDKRPDSELMKKIECLPDEKKKALEVIIDLIS